MASRFPLAAHLKFSLGLIGREQEPVLVAGDVATNPHALVDAAAVSAFVPAFGSAGGYPGLRAPAPLDYVETVVHAVTRPIAEAFALGAVRPSRAECNFSLVTLPPDALVASQRAPHVDTADPWQFAILHYLCEPQFGGTAFFRHRSTGYETISEERVAHYESARAAEGGERGYVDDGGAWFERTGEVQAMFNRLVIYRSRLLHSGRILAPAALSPDPRQGRLTANIFLTLRPFV